MKNLLLLLLYFFTSIQVLLAQNPCPQGPCSTDPVITPSTFNICPSDTLVVDSNYVMASDPSMIIISVCEYSSYTYSTPLNSSSTYNWTVTGGNIIANNNNGITVTWGSQGTGVVYVEEIDGLCYGDYTLQVDILPTPSAALTITPTQGPYCHGSDIQFLGDNTNINSAPPLFYQWDFGDGSPISTDKDPIHAYYLPAGVTTGSFICTLIVSNECQCADTITATINIIRDSLPDITTCINPVCEGETVEYTTNAINPQWDVQGGSILLNNGTDIEVQWDNTNGTINHGFGTILLTDIGINNCVSTSIIQVPVVPLNPEIIGPDTVCYGDDSYYEFGCIPAVSYTWFIGNGVMLPPINGSYNSMSGDVCDVHVRWADGLYNYWPTTSSIMLDLYPHDILGCQPVYTSKDVYISFPLEIDAAGVTEVCYGDQAQYGMMNNNNSESFFWEITNGVIAGTNSNTSTTPSTTIDVEWNQNVGVGIIKATPTHPNWWCEKSTTYVINVLDTAKTPIAINGEDWICPGETYVYSVDPSNTTSGVNATYLWTVTGGAPSTTIGNSTSITWDPTGPYSISVVNQLSSGSLLCLSNSRILTVNSLPPLTPIIENGAVSVDACINSTTNFGIGVMPVDAIISWSVSDPDYGSVTFGQGTENIVVEWTNATSNQTLTVNVKVERCGVLYSDDITVYLFAPTVDFTATPNPACPGEIISFNSTVLVSGSYSWNFDGIPAASTIANPYKSFAYEGDYMVTLTFTDNNGCVAERSKKITIKQGVDANLSFISTNSNWSYSNTNNINFCIDDGPPPEDLSLDVLLSASGSIINITWTGPNLSLSADPNIDPTINELNISCPYATIGACLGAYTVALTSSNGCTKTLTFDVDTACSSLPSTGPPCRDDSLLEYSFQCAGNGIFGPVFTYPDYPPNVVSGVTPLMWSFGDFTGFYGPTTTPSHIYSSAGVYTVSTWEAGYANQCHKIVASVDVTVPFVMDAYTTTICNGNNMTHMFYDNSSYLASEGPFTIEWDFDNDGVIDVTTNTPGEIQTYIYTIPPGNTVATMKITDANGETCTKGIMVNRPDLDAVFTVATAPFCVGVPTSSFTPTNPTFNNNDVLQWEWDFKDGSFSNIPTPKRTYTTVGTYQVDLDVLYDNGCTATGTQTVVINPNPDIQATSPPDKYCTGTTMQDLTSFATPSSFGTISWTGPGVSSSGGTWWFDPDVAGEGSHVICATETYPTGCFDDTCFTVSVFCTETPIIFGENQYCLDGSSIELSTQLGYDANGIGYEWTENTILVGGNSNTYISSANTVGLFTYTVTFTDNNGCRSTSSNFDVHISDDPLPFFINPTGPVCPNEQILLSHNGSETGVNYFWNTVPVQTANPITVNTDDRFTYQVTAINESGCMLLSNLVEVAKEILVCNIISGCWCDTALFDIDGDILIPGLANWNEYPIYRWELTTTSNTFLLSNTQNLKIGQTDPYYQDIFNGVITLSVTDQYGCTAISDPLEILDCSSSCDLELSLVDSCWNTSDTTSLGDITVSVSNGTAPYIFIFSVLIQGNNLPFDTIISSVPDATLDSLLDGQYCVEVIDGDSCVTDTCFDIFCHCCLVACIEDTCLPTGGDIEVVSIHGGTTYTYNWTSTDLTNIPDTNHLSNLPNGIYYLIIEDDSSHCVYYDTIIIDCCGLELSLVDSCWNTSDTISLGDITVSVANGTAPYTFIFSVLMQGNNLPFDTIVSSDPSATLDSLLDGQYCVQVIDGDSCITDTCFDIFCHCCLVACIEDTCLPSGGDIEVVSVHGGTTYTYNWTSSSLSNIPNTNHLSNLPNGVYYLTIEDDSSHCIYQDSIIIDCCDLQLIASDTCIEGAVAGLYYGEIDLTVTGGVSPYTYSWSGPNGFSAFTEDITNLADGEYCVVVYSGFLCGDANLDGIVDAADLYFITDLVLNSQYSLNADINCDGVVNVIDVTLVSDHLTYGTPLTCCVTNTPICIDSICINIDCELDTTNCPLTLSAADRCITESCDSCIITIRNVVGQNAMTIPFWLEVREPLGPEHYIQQNATSTSIGSVHDSHVTVSCYSDTFNLLMDPSLLGLEDTVKIYACGHLVYQVFMTGSGPMSVTYPNALPWFPPSGQQVYYENLTSTSLDLWYLFYSQGYWNPSNNTIGGAINLSASGGNSGYTYLWTGPNFNAITEDIDGLLDGTYCVTVTDLGNPSCPAENLCVTIDCDSCLTISGGYVCIPDTGTNPNNNAGGTIYVNVSGGSGSYVYSWDFPGLIGSNVSGLADGTYCVTVTDFYDASCSEVLCFTIVCPIFGCTDPNATNYDPYATIDDGSCLYPPLILLPVSDTICLGDLVTITWTGGNPNDLVNLSLQNSTLSSSVQTIALNIPNTHSYTWVCQGPGAVAGTDLYNFYIQNHILTTWDYGSLFIIDTCVNSSVCSPITGVHLTDIIHDRATFNWDNMNSSTCDVDQIRFRYREVGTNTYSTKTMGVPVGSGCNTANISKLVLNLTPSTQYEYDFKIWYCNAATVNWHANGTFTTADVCVNATNMTATPVNTAVTSFCWDAPSSPWAFVRLQYRENVPGSSFSNIGGFGVMAPALCKDKYGLTAGTQYRVMWRTWCNVIGGPYRSPQWDGPVIWDQPSVIRLEGSTAITNLDVYPNPSRDIFNITFTSETVQDLKVRVLNVIGEELIVDDLQQFVGEYTKSINLAENAKGVYFLEITTNNGVVNKKLILQ